jgi:hypothetical protein
MIKTLTAEESLAAMKSTLERAEQELAALSQKELAANPAAPTGACCLYTYGVASCTGGVTYAGCQQAAANTGTMFKWTAGKSCTQTTCP